MLQDKAPESVLTELSPFSKPSLMYDKPKLRKETGIPRRDFLKMAMITGVSVIAIGGLAAPVSADIPDVTKISIEMEGEDAVIVFEIRHADPTSNHYVDTIQVSGTYPLLLNNPSQTDDVFTYKHNLGKVEGTITIIARAHCTLHDWGSSTTYTTTITTPTPGPSPSPSPTPTPTPTLTPTPTPTPIPTSTPSPTPTPTPVPTPSPTPQTTTTPTPSPSPTPTTTPTTTPTSTPTPTPKPEGGLPLELIGLPVIAIIAIGGYLIYRRTKR